MYWRSSFLKSLVKYCVQLFIMMPAISVLMTVYNSQQYLHESINSILSQSFSNFEFLIFNDGSTDGSKEIIESFDDPRISFVNFSYNQGYAPL